MLLTILMLPSTTLFKPPLHHVKHMLSNILANLAHKFPSLTPFFFYLHHISFILHQPFSAFHLLHTVYSLKKHIFFPTLWSLERDWSNRFRSRCRSGGTSTCRTRNWRSWCVSYRRHQRCWMVPWNMAKPRLSSCACWTLK